MAVGIPLLVLSMVVLAHELLLLRVISICHWHHFGSLVISVALLGFGVAGVAGRGGGVGDSVKDGETGLLVDPRDEKGISAALERLLRDRDLAERLGRNGRRRVVEELDWRLLAPRYHNVMAG